MTSDDHPHSPGQLARQIEEIRAITKRSCQILRDNPKPDSFAGRKTQEPFPKEAETIEGYLKSKELKPPT